MSTDSGTVVRFANPVTTGMTRDSSSVSLTTGAPGRVVYANRGAQSLFAGDLPALGRRLLLGAEPGARRVVALSRSLLPGAAPRLERLRFFFGPVAETVTVLCRRATVAPGNTLFALAVLGLRAPQATARRSGDVEPPHLKIASDAVAATPVTAAPGLSRQTQQNYAPGARCSSLPWGHFAYPMWSTDIPLRVRVG